MRHRACTNGHGRAASYLRANKDSERRAPCATGLARMAMAEPHPIFVPTKIVKGERTDLCPGGWILQSFFVTSRPLLPDSGIPIRPVPLKITVSGHGRGKSERFGPVVQWIEFQIPVLTIGVRISSGSQKRLQAWRHRQCRRKFLPEKATQASRRVAFFLPTGAFPKK